MEVKTVQNPELQLAHDFVQYTGKNIFLTGKAGTGKTTFLKKLKEESPKRMIVVAPTGVAAINAGGVTIHSFFQLPFGPIVPGYAKTEAKSFVRFSREKRNIIRSLDLLVIDEISMVRADLLDGIDEVLRRFRKNNKPFGGVQMLMIGDMQQLPPVVKEQEWYLLRKHYKTAYFFGSLALNKSDFVTITLQHVYRQQDQDFLDILNKIREKRIDDQVISRLSERYIPDFRDEEENHITLTTHNAKARSINESKLNELESGVQRFHAKVNGDFPEYSYPTEYDLELKVGAQVMFVKNDPEVDKRFYNGKIGIVTHIGEEEVTVVSDEEEPIIVKPLEWQNIKYTVDEHTKEINEKVEGSFIQIPLKLAWAITIHKSQGLTFDRVIIDSQMAFAHGQVYVALSRCRTLEGLVLSTPFSSSSLKADRNIEDFNVRVERQQPGKEDLDISKVEFQEQLLLDLFDFGQLHKEIIWFGRQLEENITSIVLSDSGMFKKMKSEFEKEIHVVSMKFQAQLSNLLGTNGDAEQNEELQARMMKAVPYFIDKLNGLVQDPLDALSIDTDNKEIKKTITKAEENLVNEVSLKLACLASCSDGFEVKQYMVERAKASMEAPTKKRKKKQIKPEVSDEISNPGLYDLIKNWRNVKSREQGVSVFMVLPLKTMRALSAQVPSTMDDLKKVHGFGKKKIEHFGEEILELINNYREHHDVEIVLPGKRKNLNITPKKPTRALSFELWQKHRDIIKVAQERGMAPSTIEGHLAHFVGTGKLAVEDFVDSQKMNPISTFFTKNPEATLGEAREQLGEDYSYTELKFVREHVSFTGGLEYGESEEA
jgi:hypothetical protein